MDGIHVVDECFHGLVYTVHGAVDGMLFHALVALHEKQVFGEIVIDRCIIEMLQVGSGEVFNVLHFLYITFAYIRSEIEVECRDGLSSMHFVLYGLHGDACHDGSGFDAFGRARLAMSCHEAIVQNLVERMLDASKRFGRIIILVVDVEVIVLYRPKRFFGQKIVVYEGFGGL